MAVAKRYKPGDRVHLPTEGKWATILWTGRIDDEWVVDLVYVSDELFFANMQNEYLHTHDKLGRENYNHALLYQLFVSHIM